VLIPLVGAILAGSAAHGMAPQALAQQTIALGAPKWDVGDQWTWQIGNDQITWTVLSAGGEYVVQEKSATETGVFHVAADFSSISASSAYFLPQFYELRFPLALGKAWTSTKRVATVGSINSAGDVEVTRITEGVVSITVPGGTFEAVRISGRSHVLTAVVLPRVGAGEIGRDQPGEFLVAGGVQWRLRYLVCPAGQTGRTNHLAGSSFLASAI